MRDQLTQIGEVEAKIWGDHLNVNKKYFEILHIKSMKTSM